MEKLIIAIRIKFIFYICRGYYSNLVRLGGYDIYGLFKSKGII